MRTGEGMKWLLVVDHAFVPQSKDKPDVCECGLPITAPCHQPSLFEITPKEKQYERSRADCSRESAAGRG
jgi:hypothetical protein